MRREDKRAINHGQITASARFNSRILTCSVTGINMPHKHIETSQTGFQGVPHVDHKQLKVHRLNEDRPIDKSHYMMTWFGEIHGGEPILGHFFGPSVFYTIEGEFHLEDKSKPGQIFKLIAGDVLHIDEGSDILWASPTGGKGFGVCYAPSTLHPEDLPAKK